MLFAGVDQCLGAVGPLLRRVLCRIQPSAPGITQDVDVIDRIAATAHRPNNLIHVGGIDVLVDGNDPLSVIRAARDLRGESECLRRVTGIALLERDDGHAKSASTGGISIDTLDTGYTKFLQVVPDSGRAYDREKAALFVGRIVRH